MMDIPDCLCIGAAHWDVIGHSPAQIAPGDDVPGQIYQSAGGVALNVARALAQQGHRPALIAAIGQDGAGTALVATIQAAGIETRCLVRSALPTDAYIGIEDTNGLIAAIAASRALEGLDIGCLAPLQDGRLGSDAVPWRGPVVIDSGVSPSLLEALAYAPALEGCDVRLTAASPAKAARLRVFLGRQGCCFYLNLAEAGALCATPFPDSAHAARALLGLGAARVLVTHGPHSATDADAAAVITLPPPAVPALRVTGAGDHFMGAHIAQELSGAPREIALRHALNAAAAHVSQAPHPS
ncbi:MAG: PfkB family carbohydrate kinase [Roseinatronobacter sp.]